MSAFQLSANHIAALVDASLSIAMKHHGDSFDTRERHRRLMMLADENHKSIAFLYRSNSPKQADKFPRHVNANFPAYNGWVVRDRGVVTLLKAVSCYEYQSCEHTDWNDSEAKKFCVNLREMLIGELPGYDTAEGWGLE